jgi:hypothetical protein
MPIDAETARRADALLKEGKVNEASELLQKAAAESDKAEAEARGEKPKREPRNPDEIIQDFFDTVASLFGNHPRLEELLAELEEARARRSR